MLDAYLSLAHITAGMLAEPLFNAFATTAFFQAPSPPHRHRHHHHHPTLLHTTYVYSAGSWYAHAEQYAQAE